ncbi:short-chain dehydrogenase [Pontibacillus halophilus JSM 076056 = DSM 19796]|uniref:Short-chain dehydrogenase n=1 Tax=Pontibacillus halophilus JSM 076056 = DSM 19796 TaxID=1385510 RepID=A0A0A5GSA0_9BACI|nr:SDR family oxidoreductase [Pontibacillus halophilus]KGX94000.1 short-chain dehydrogenase [Pontibacillus halophilus JSM 076056 = DSM 19796]
MKPTVLITGASSGLGYEFAKLFGLNGYDLVVVARNEQKLEELKASLPHVTVTVLPKDLSLPHAAEEIYRTLVDKDIEIHYLVNNAGFGLNGEFEKLSLRQQQEMIQVNITALTDLTYWFLPDMKKHANNGLDTGILNVASTAAFLPGPHMAVYYASKAYVLSFSEGLNGELGRTNVHVSTLCPGPTSTNFFTAAKADNMKIAESSAMTAQKVAKIGFEGFQKKQSVIIPGASNKASAYAAKFIPRKLAATFAKKFNGA